MTVEQMREFVILAEERNYLVAADMLFSTQATLSRHIMAMEEELGFSLFSRSTKKIELTPEGSRFLIYARRAARLQDACLAELGTARREATETVRVGYNALVTFYHFTEMLTRFMAGHPEIPMKITEADADVLLKAVTRGECDAAFVQVNPFFPPAELERIPFASDVMMAVLPVGHPLAKRRSIALSQLADEEFVTGEVDREPTSVFLEACRRAGFEPKIAHAGLVGPAVFEWVGSSNGVSLEWRVPGLTHGDSRTVLVGIDPPIRSQTCLVFRRDRLSEVGKKLAAYFREHAELPREEERK